MGDGHEFRKLDDDGGRERIFVVVTG